MNRIRIYCLALVVLLMASCQRHPLEKAVKAYEKECPVAFGSAGILQHVSLEDGHTVVYHFQAGELVDVAALANNAQLFKQAICQQYAHPTPELRSLFQAIVKENGSLKIRLTGQRSSDEVTYVITTAELQSILAGEVEAPSDDEVLAMLVEGTNRQMPIVATGLVVESLVDEGETVTYAVKVDESLISFETLEAGQAQMHDNLLNALLEDPSAVEFLRAVQACHKGIAYRYYTEANGKSILIVITADELASAIGK